MPTLVGYASVKGTILSPTPILMAALVVLWIPSHIWSLALRYKEDYQRAGVPMLPVVIREKAAIRCIASTSILLVAFALSLSFLGTFGLVYLIVTIASSIAMLTLNLWLITNPSRDRAWRVFKFSSPYLALLFTGMMVDTLLLSK